MFLMPLQTANTSNMSILLPTGILEDHPVENAAHSADTI
jgi:hypothetical protein